MILFLDLSVYESLTEYRLVLSRPKTGNSIREVSVLQDAVELLKQEHAKHPGNPWMFPSGRSGEKYPQTQW